MLCLSNAQVAELVDLPLPAGRRVGIQRSVCNNSNRYTVLKLESLAQVAELVDALVSNTNGLGRAGSIPALGTNSD